MDLERVHLEAHIPDVCRGLGKRYPAICFFAVPILKEDHAISHADHEPADPTSELEARLHELQELHGAGELDDEEFALARRLAVLGSAGTGPPEKRAGHSKAPSTDGAAPRPPSGRSVRWVWAVAGAVVVAAVGVVVGIFIAGGASDSGTYRGPGADIATLRLTALFTGAESGRCFGPRTGASFTVNGIKQSSDFLNCGDDNPIRATGAYAFAPLPDGVLTRFTGVFAVDEGSWRAQAGSTAHFTVTFGSRTLCDLTVSWRQPERCNVQGLRIPTEGRRLRIRQDVVPATFSPTAGLWAGVAHGRVFVRRGGPE